MNEAVTSTELQGAVKDAFLDKVKALAANEMSNEVTEDPEEAEKQFARGLRIAIDGLERCMAEVEKIP